MVWNGGGGVKEAGVKGVKLFFLQKEEYRWNLGGGGRGGVR